MWKKLIQNVINFVSIVLIILSLLVLLTVVLTRKGDVPSFMGYSLFRVMTGSMEPEIPTNSLIVVKKVSPEELKVGDVISFFSRDPALYGEVNTHRIIEIEQENGKYCFLTQGDANNVPDRYPTPEEDLVGIVVMSTVTGGKVVRLLSNPLIFFPVIFLPLLVLLLKSIYESFVVAKKLVREEEEAAVREAIDAILKEKESGNNE